MERSEVLAYGGGHGAMVYHPDGKSLCVGGSDACIKVFDANDLTTTVTMDDNSDAVTAMAFNFDGTRLSCAAEHAANMYIFTGSKTAPNFEGAITRLTGQIRSIAVNASDDLVAVSGDEVEIKLINMANRSDIKVLVGHSCAVKCVAFNGQGTHLASAGIDGRMIIWNIADGATEKQFETSAMAKTALESSDMMGLHWSNSLLAAPFRMDVATFCRKSEAKWSQSCILTGGHTDKVSIVRWSQNGLYLASASADLTIVVWDYKTKAIVATRKIEHSCIGLEWSPTDNVIAYLTVIGVLTRWCEPVPRDLPHPSSSVEEIAADKEGAEEGSDDESGADDVGSDEGDKKPTDPDRRKRRRLVRDESDLESEEDIISKDAISSHPLSRFQLKPQSPFQPGSTFDHGEAFLMAWTLFGSIESTYVDQALRRIQINFADIDSRPRIRLTDRLGFTKACLGTHSALFSSPAKESIPATIFYKAFDSWAANSDWSMSVPDGEDVACIGLIGRTAAIVTNLQILRIVSFSGVHKTILCVDGPVVAMTGSSSLLATIIDNGCGLSYVVYDTSNESIRRVSGGRCPITLGSTLRWLCYSENGILVTMDSALMFRGLFPQRGQYEWIPITNGRQHTSTPRSTLWPVGASATDILAAVLKNGQTQPNPSSRPILNGIPFTLPLLIGDTHSVSLEQKNLLNGLMITTCKDKAARGSNRDKAAAKAAMSKAMVQQDVAVIELIQAACQNDIPTRALDLASSLQMKKSLDAAIKVVASMNQPSLVERMTLLASVKFPEQKPSSPSAEPIRKVATPPNIPATPAIKIDFSPSPATRPISEKAQIHPIALGGKGTTMGLSQKAQRPSTQLVGFSSQLDLKRTGSHDAKMSSFSNLIGKSSKSSSDRSLFSPAHK